jgi:prepilin-type N-terminal cleavage/methylation domain-containing protein
MSIHQQCQTLLIFKSPTNTHLAVKHYPKPTRSNGFSLVEAILTIAIMSILTGIVINSVTNATKDAGRMVGRQQQTAVQTAVNSWVTSNARYPQTYPDVNYRGKTRPISDIRTEYNALANSLARFNKVAEYLDESTRAHFNENTTDGNKLKTEGLKKAKQYLSLPTWSAGSSPEVHLGNDS